MPSFTILRKSDLFAAAQHYVSARKALMGDGAPPRLKGFQDAAAFAAIAGYHNRRGGGPLAVADIGGDQSRILPMLLQHSPDIHGTIIDTWSESIGNGTLTVPEDQPRITIIDALLGQPSSRDKIPDAAFDVVTSISVVEHILVDELEAFFADSLRICKPGGMIAHYVDLHVSNAEFNQRGAKTVEAATAAWGTLDDQPESWAFRTEYVSNPDNIMYRWGERADNMPVRATNQVICLVGRCTTPA